MNTFTDGIHDISSDDYHASDAVSRSNLILLDQSPYHYWYSKLSGLAQKKAPTPSMILGSLFHTMILEPDLFHKDYALMPSLNRKTAAGKESYAQFLELSQGKQIVTTEQMQQVEAMVRSVRSHSIVNDLLEDCVFERSIFWTDKETGLQFKARPDAWSSSLVIDLKTTREEATKYNIQRAAMKYGYYLQAGMMFEACKAVDEPFQGFVLLAVETSEPYAPAIYMLDEESIQYGVNHFNELKYKLAECMNANEWPTYEISELTLPAYLKG